MSMFSRWGVGASILMYHSIADDSDEPYTVSINDFRQQISWLHENGFEVISLSSLLKLIQLEDHQSLQKKVVITFDDGFKDFATNALPILLDHGAPATVFLVTDLFGEKAAWNKNGADVRLMTEDEVRYIKEKGVSLGSHTASHVNIALEDREGMKRQLKESLDVLTRLGETFYAFAYPWGQWSVQAIDEIKSSGYECALVVGEQTRLNAENRYLLPRVSMTSKTNLKKFQSLLNRTNIEKELRRKYRTLREKKLSTTGG